MADPKDKKTWGREVSFGLLVYICVLAWQGKVDEVSALSVIATPLILAAFVIKNPAVQDRIAPKREKL